MAESNDKYRAALEAARNGLQWYRDAYPEADSGADDEMMALIEEALASKAAAPGLPIELRAVAETAKEGGGFWRSCSGCHELNEGHDTGPRSAVFGCALGNGCSECGGIGAVWDTTDYGAMVDSMAAADSAAPASGDADMVLVPRQFVSGFNTLAHNYSLRAVPPDHYSGTEGDAFSNAYARCGRDLKALAEVLAAARPAAQEAGTVPAAGDDELADHLEVIAGSIAVPGAPDAHRNTSSARLLEAASRLRALAAPAPAAPDASPSAGEAAWSDCKVAFSVDDEDALWLASDARRLALPRGWTLVETDASGARCVAIFRVEGPPSLTDGALVRAELERLDRAVARRRSEGGAA